MGELLPLPNPIERARRDAIKRRKLGHAVSEVVTLKPNREQSRAAEMSRRELSDAARSYYWNRLEEHERMAEIYRRALGMIANERGVPPVLEPGEGQLTLMNPVEGEDV